MDQLLWVTTGHILAATITTPNYGKLGDLLGRKGLFIGSLTIFLIGGELMILSQVIIAGPLLGGWFTESIGWCAGMCY